MKDKEKIEVGDIVEDGDLIYRIKNKFMAKIVNRPRMGHIKKIGITLSKSKQEKREIWDFLAKSGVLLSINLKYKNKLKSFCEVEE